MGAGVGTAEGRGVKWVLLMFCYFVMIVVVVVVRRGLEYLWKFEET